MSHIKIVYYNFGNANSVIESRINKYCESAFYIKSGLAMVKYAGSAHELYNQINTPENQHHIMIIDVDTSSYWGYMKKPTWQWLKDNKDNT